MARLSNGAPAGCLAEDIIAVGLIEEARVWLELRREEGRLDKDQERAASEELRGLFELFEDDDVLNMFDMAEPRRLPATTRSISSWASPISEWSHGLTRSPGHRRPGI
jgi:hypothetical protein